VTLNLEFPVATFGLDVWSSFIRSLREAGDTFYWAEKPLEGSQIGENRTRNIFFVDILVCKVAPKRTAGAATSRRLSDMHF
jgi:hypothetical protein